MFDVATAEPPATNGHLHSLAIPLTMQQAGAAMSGTGMTEEAFKQMMLDGGRPIEGNRSKSEKN